MKATLYVDSPVGRLEIVSDGKNVKSITLSSSSGGTPDAVTEKVASELNEYFSGKREKFDVPLEPDGSDFCKKVWAALRDIPYGKTFTYGQVAETIGMKGAARAVGGAVGRNPVLIMIPCHRVVAKDGIGGFSSGADKKKILLGIESK